MYVQVSPRGMIRLIRVRNVGFLVGQLNYVEESQLPRRNVEWGTEAIA